MLLMEPGIRVKPMAKKGTGQWRKEGMQRKGVKTDWVGGRVLRASIVFSHLHNSLNLEQFLKYQVLRKIFVDEGK